MSTLPNHTNEILRAAIAWALSVADAAKETLVAAVLAEALFHAEELVTQQDDPRERPDGAYLWPNTILGRRDRLQVDGDDSRQ